MLSQLLFWIKTWFGVTEEEGQGLVEYALIIVLVSIAVIIILGVLGVEIGKVFNDITTALQNR